MTSFLKDFHFVFVVCYVLIYILISLLIEIKDTDKTNIVTLDADE